MRWSIWAEMSSGLTTTATETVHRILAPEADDAMVDAVTARWLVDINAALAPLGASVFEEGDVTIVPERGTTVPTVIAVIQGVDVLAVAQRVRTEADARAAVAQRRRDAQDMLVETVSGALQQGIAYLTANRLATPGDLVAILGGELDSRIRGIPGRLRGDILIDTVGVERSRWGALAEIAAEAGVTPNELSRFLREARARRAAQETTGGV